METFVSKPITSAQTIGERLRKAREGAGMGLAELSGQINIRASYLAAIESGRYNEMPGEVYTVEYLKAYARFLGFSVRATLEAYRAERSASISGRMLGPVLRSRYIQNGISKFSYGLRLTAVIAVLAIAGYAVSEKGGLFAPPELNVTSPVPQNQSTQGIVAISGQTNKDAIVYLNNGVLPTDEAGSFTETLYLSEGTHLLAFTVRDEWGRKRTEYRSVTVGPDKKYTLVLNKDKTDEPGS